MKLFICWLCDFPGHDETELQAHLKTLKHVKNLVAHNLFCPEYLESMSRSNFFELERNGSCASTGVVSRVNRPEAAGLLAEVKVEEVNQPREVQEAQHGPEEQQGETYEQREEHQHGPNRLSESQQEHIVQGQKLLDSKARKRKVGLAHDEEPPHKRPRLATIATMDNYKIYVTYLTCVCCDIGFPYSKKSFQNHMDSAMHSKRKKYIQYAFYKCSKCENKFEECQISEHFGPKRKFGSALRCAKVRRGMNSVCAINMFNCSNCNFSFNSLDAVLKHINDPEHLQKRDDIPWNCWKRRNIFRDGIGGIFCNACLRSLKSLNALIYHGVCNSYHLMQVEHQDRPMTGYYAKQLIK